MKYRVKSYDKSSRNALSQTSCHFSEKKFLRPGQRCIIQHDTIHNKVTQNEIRCNQEREPYTNAKTPDQVKGPQDNQETKHRN